VGRVGRYEVGLRRAGVEGVDVGYIEYHSEKTRRRVPSTATPADIGREPMALLRSIFGSTDGISGIHFVTSRP
jgi:hypothetical protein